MKDNKEIMERIAETMDEEKRAIVEDALESLTKIEPESDTPTKDIPREYVEMAFVKETATGRGRNEFFIMENLKNGMMKTTQGRIGITIGRYKPTTRLLPLEDWDAIYEGKIKKGYMPIKTKKMAKVEITKGQGGTNGDFAPIEDVKVRTFVDELVAFAKHIFETSYTVKVDDISDEMIDLGRKTLDSLSSGYADMSLAEFNNKLKLLYTAIPRRMDKLSSHLARHKQDFAGILADEEDLFDVMVSQVRENRQEHKEEKTILDANRIEMRTVTPEEEAYLKKILRGNAGKYMEAYKVCNHETAQELEHFAKDHDLSMDNGIKHLFHGTKHENVWSILTTGIKNRPPKDTVITGKAYGQGSYFAPDAIKSLGYTSRVGAKWTSGGQSYGLLLVCKVAVGKDGTYYDGHLGCDSSLTWNKLKAIKPDALCTWAESRYSGFMMDEVIVYQDCQDTVDYVIKVSA